LNVVTLDASATAEVPSDLLTVTLFTEQVRTQVSSPRRSTRGSKKRLPRRRLQPRVEAHSGSYQTNPVYDRANQITGWRIRAEVVLESRDFKAVGALAGTLQPLLRWGR
jgi:predicted secreted protein